MDRKDTRNEINLPRFVKNLFFGETCTDMCTFESNMYFASVASFVCLLGQFGLNVVQVIHFFINSIYYLK